MARKVEISRTELSPKQLRRYAIRAGNLPLMRRLNAIADALESVSGGQDAKGIGMNPQTASDWMHQFSDEGPEGLKDRPRKGRWPKPSLAPEQLERLAERVRAGQDPEVDGLARWRRRDLQKRLAKEEGVHLHGRAACKILGRLGFSWIKPRPLHPKADIEAQEEFKKL